jgi:hypothetical protein
MSDDYSKLVWEEIERDTYWPGQYYSTYTSGRSLFTERAKVKNGWLVRTRIFVREVGPRGAPGASQGIGAGEGVGLAFVPDPDHGWTL